MIKKNDKLNNKNGYINNFLSIYNFESAGGILIILTAALTILTFSTITTTAFIVPKSFLLRFSAFVIAAHHIISGGFKLKSHPLNFAVFCYFLSVFFSTFASVSPLTSILRLSEYLSYFLIFLFTFNYFSRSNINSLINALLYIAIPAVFYGILQYMQIDFSFWQKPEGRMDLFSTIGNVNWYALYLSAMAPIAVYGTFRFKSSKYEKTIFGILLFFIIISIVISYSRTAVIASLSSCIITIAAYLILCRAAFSKKFILRSAALLLIFFIAAAVFSYYNPISQNRFAEGGFLNRMKAGFSLAEKNVAQRLFIWRITLDMYLMKPVLGLGPGTFKIKYLEHQKEFIKRTNTPDSFDELAGNAKEAHNDYLQTLAESGTAGLAAMLYFFFIVYKTGIKFVASRMADNSADNNDLKFLCFASLCSLGALLTGAFADFPFHVPPNAMLIFMLSGIIAAISNDNKNFIELKDNFVHLYSLKTAFIVFIFILMIFTVILPFIADCLTVTGQNYLKEHDFGAAVPYLKQAVSMNPAQGDALYLLGTAFIGMISRPELSENNELLEAGHDFLMKSKKYTTDKGIYNNLGFIAIRKKEYDAAAVHFEDALGCDPKSSDSLNNIGIVYFHKKLYDRAEYYYKKALKMNPYFLTAANNLGDLYSKKNEFEKAFEYYNITVKNPVKKVIEENQRRNIFNFTPESYLNEKSRAYYQIAEIYLNSGALEKALDFYIKAFECINTMPQIPLKISLTNFKLGRKEEGRKYAQLVIKNTPPDSVYNRQASEILLKYDK